MATASLGTYRAKDIEMAAVARPATRELLLTGAIDSEDHDILVRLEVPDEGPWRVVKAETNLTSQSWRAWQITFGENTRLADDVESRPWSRQFRQVFVSEAKDRVVFYDGEVRPGEPVVKAFPVVAAGGAVVMSHNRVAGIPGQQLVDDRLEASIREGFTPRPIIESFIRPVVRD